MSAKHDLADLLAVKDQVGGIATDDLKQELAEGFRLTRDRFLRLGAIIVELDSRGEKVEGDKYLCRLLRKIGQGELIVDVVIKFAGRPYTLASIVAAKLSNAEQKELLHKSDNEVEEKFGAHSVKKTVCRAKHLGCDQFNWRGIATKATAPDLAEMCIDMVMAHVDPQLVASIMINEIQKIAQGELVAA